MLEFVFLLGTDICFGIADVVTKKSIRATGLHKSAAYAYAIMVALMVAGAVFLGNHITLPKDMLSYLIEISVGAAAVLALFKALEEGKASIIAPLAKLNVLIILIIGILVLGETLSQFQLVGSLLVVGSALLLSFVDLKKFKLEKGVFYIAITILGWGYYYSFFKIFVAELGAYQAMLVLETGVAAIVIAYCIIMRKDLSLPSFQHSKYIGARSISLAAGTLFYSSAVNITGAALAAAIVSASPVVTAILSYKLLNEKLDNYKYAAILAMVAGLVLIFLSS